MNKGSSPGALPTSQNSPEITPARAPRVLVVEDDIHLAHCLASCLEAHGYEARIACDGLEAWRQFESDQPDVVCLDLNIPSLSGFRLLRLMKASNPSLPVLVVTAYAFQEVEEVANAGADDFIMKPFNLDDLATKLRWYAPTTATQADAGEPGQIGESAPSNGCEA